MGTEDIDRAVQVLSAQRTTRNVSECDLMFGALILRSNALCLVFEAQQRYEETYFTLYNSQNELISNDKWVPCRTNQRNGMLDGCPANPIKEMKC